MVGKHTTVNIEDKKKKQRQIDDNIEEDNNNNEDVAEENIAGLSKKTLKKSDPPKT